MDEDDFLQFDKGLSFSIERSWEPHEFDKLLVKATTLIDVVALDIGKYRDTRIKIWRETVGLFLVRSDAEDASFRSI
ncbi:hypothetical protein RBA41_28860 [Massilia sp. CCM 9210]|uniref:hypothetical protein n=1 Tax=Massilia scottii TaxID=3057166 RepID=UPI0027968F29|nr:hypothetical protein [Massilia sp. CCM 9210]MDQ1817324.1 hypothetical protein [Massilia sp. CCM 9210]